MKNKPLLVVACALGIAVLMYFFAPEEKLEPLKSVFRSAKKNECLDLWRSRFDNPGSLVYVDSYEWHEKGWHRLTIKYRAKNSFGAWVSNHLSCGLDGAGKINRAETFRYQDDRNYGLIGNGPADYPVPAPAPR